MAIRNNVTRLLDSRDIAYEAIELPDDEKRGAVETAARIGAPPEQVFKTIVLLRAGRGKPILAVIPGPVEVDLKRAAAVLDEKKVTLPTQREAEKITGLRAGGISPLALYDKGFEILLDEFSLVYEEFYVSGGERRLNIRMRVDDFIALTDAQIAALT